MTAQTFPFEMRFTNGQLNAYYARRMPNKAPAGGVEKEAELQEAIIEECRRRGWIALYSRMDKPTTARIGQPDFTIIADNGRVFFIEAKRKGGKLSEEQAALHAWASRLGHSVHTVYSLNEFMEAVK